MTPNTAVPTMPIIEPEVQARVEALAAVREPRLEPSITEAEAVAEAHTDLWESVMKEAPNGAEPTFGRLVNGRYRPKSGPVEE